jgi:hypothetical protein
MNNLFPTSHDTSPIRVENPLPPSRSERVINATKTAWNSTKTRVVEKGVESANLVTRITKAPFVWACQKAAAGAELGVESLKTRFKQALLGRQIPQELLLLKEKLDEFIQNPDNVTFDDVKSTYQYLKILSAENHKMLNLLAPNLKDQEKELFTCMLSTLEQTAQHGSCDNPTDLEKHAESFRASLKDVDYKRLFTDFNKVFNKILDQNQEEGAIRSALTYIQEALLSEENGLIKQSIGKLTELLTQKDGPMEKLRQQASGKDNSFLSDAIKLFNDSLLGLPDKDLLSLKEALNKFNAPDNIQFDDLVLAYGHMKSLLDGHGKILEPLASELQEDGKISFYEILRSIEEHVQEPEYDDSEKLKKAKAFSEKFKDAGFKTYFDTHFSSFTKTLDDILNRHKGSLEKALDSLRKAFLSEDKGLVKQVIDKLRDELSGKDESVLSDVIKLLSNSLFSAKDGILTRLRYEVTNEERGLLAETLKALWHGINGKEGKDGLLKKTLDALETRLTDEKEGIITRAFDFLNKKLREEKGPFDYIEFRLTDEEVGVLNKALNFLEKRLMDKGGLIDQIDKKITEPIHPLLTDSRTKMNRLLEAIINNNKTAIKRCSATLRPLLEQLTANHKVVFAKQPLQSLDLTQLNKLKDKLPSFFGENPPSQEKMRRVVESALAAVNKYYADTGIVQRIADIFSDRLNLALDPFLSRVENLPRTMFNSLMGGQDPIEPDTAPVDRSPEKGTVSDFINESSAMLKTMFDNGLKTVSKQTLNWLSRLFTLGLEQVSEKMGDSEAYRQPKAALQEAIHALATLSENGNWTALFPILQQTSQALNGLKLYVNGFSIPQMGSSTERRPSAESNYLDNIARLQEVTDPAVKEPENQHWESLANTEKNKFFENMGDLLTVQTVFEKVCGKPSNNKFYLSILSEARKKGKDSKSELKRLFFQALDKENIGFFTKIFAQILYYFYGEVINKFATEASNIYFKEIFQYIKAHKAEEFTTLRNQITTNFTRYLTILGSAYENIAKQPATGTLEEMLREELEKKESNLGFETKELYIEFMLSVLKKPLNLNFIPRFFPSFISKFFSNTLSWVVGKLIGNPEQIVRAVIDKTAESLQDTRGYTHALNTVIHEQLSKIWKMLQVNDLNDQNGRTKISLEMSDIKKDQLAKLVKNLFEVLRKTQCHTIAELRESCTSNRPSDHVNKAIDDLFIDDVVKEVSYLLAVSIQSFTEKDQLEKLTYDLARLANRTFEIDEDKITLDALNRQEREISALYEKILRFATRDAVKKKFDISGEKQQNQTNHLIQELRDRCLTYFTKAAQDLTELLKTPDIATVKDKIDKFVKEAMDFQSRCYDSHFQIKSLEINSDNRNEVANRYLGIAEQSKLFVEAVGSLKQHANTLEGLQTALLPLDQINGILTRIELRICANSNANLEDVQFAENQMKVLKTHLEELKKNRNIASQHRQISAQTVLIDTFLSNMRKEIEARTLGLKPPPPNSLLNIAVEKHKYKVSATKIQAAIADTRLLDPDTRLNATRSAREAIVCAQQHLQQLSLWEEEHVKPIPYINSTVVDMRWFEDWVAEVIYSRVEPRIDGFRKFLKSEEAYRFGLNQWFFIPYVQAQKELA